MRTTQQKRGWKQPLFCWWGIIKREPEGPEEPDFPEGQEGPDYPEGPDFPEGPEGRNIRKGRRPGLFYRYRAAFECGTGAAFYLHSDQFADVVAALVEYHYLVLLRSAEELFA